MNREFLFRGRRLDTGEWAEGFYFCRDTQHYIKVPVVRNGVVVLTDYEVNPDTIGQFTGRLDKNGKRVFEGDVVIDHRGAQGVVAWDNECSRYMVYSHWKGEKYVGYVGRDKPHTVISTIHDQPEKEG